MEIHGKSSQLKEALIIIPAYNEEKSIRAVLDKLESSEVMEFADILVMNDASNDDTNWIVKERHHTLVTHVFNLGYGSALQLGYKYAIRRDYRYVIEMDADGQHDVCNIPVIYKKLKEKDEDGKYPDLVLGSRFMEGGKDYQVSLAKRWAYALFRAVIRIFTGKKIADPTTGLQGISRRAFLYYSKYSHFDDKYPDANIILQMLLLGFKVVQVPAIMHPRDEGSSMHAGLRPLMYMIRMCFSLVAVIFRIKVFKIDVGATDKYDEDKKNYRKP